MTGVRRELLAVPAEPDDRGPALHHPRADVFRTELVDVPPMPIRQSAPYRGSAAARVTA
jgi:hypothetical protein